MDANPDLAAARQEIGIADGARKQAGLIPNPTISYDVEDTRRNTSQTTVSLSQTLELGGKRGLVLTSPHTGRPPHSLS